MERSGVIRPKTSGKLAAMRLKQTIAADYLECSGEQLRNLQREITEILSRYVRIEDAKEISLKLIQETQQGEPYVKTIQIKGL